MGEGSEADRTEPGCQQAGVLARCHPSLPIDPTREQRLPFVQVLLVETASHSLPGLLYNLELNRTGGLSLHDRGSGSPPPIQRHIIDPGRNQVTGAQLAVEREVEQGQITDAMSNPEPTPNGPDLLRLSEAAWVQSACPGPKGRRLGRNGQR